MKVLGRLLANLAKYFRIFFLNVPLFLIFELLATPGAHKTAPADIQSIPHIALSVQYHSIMI